MTCVDCHCVGSILTVGERLGDYNVITDVSLVRNTCTDPIPQILRVCSARAQFERVYMIDNSPGPSIYLNNPAAATIISLWISGENFATCDNATVSTIVSNYEGTLHFFPTINEMDCVSPRPKLLSGWIEEISLLLITLG